MGMISDLWVKLGLKSDDYTKGLEKAKGETKSFGSSISSMFKQLADTLGLGAVVTQIEVATAGIGKFFLSLKTAATGSVVFSKAMQVIRFALISTGIGAIVVAFGTLIAYFTQTERGAEKLAKGLAAIRAVFQVLIDRTAIFGEGVYKILTGDFKGGWDALKSSVKGVGTEMALEGKTAMELADRLEELENREIELTNSIAERKEKAEQLRLEAKQEVNDINRKSALLKEAAAIYKTVFADEKSIANEKAAIYKAQISMGSVMDSQRKKLAELQADANKKGTEEAKILKAIQREMTGVNAELREQVALRNQVDAALAKPMARKEGEKLAGGEGTALEDLGLAPVESTMSGAQAMLNVKFLRMREMVTQFNQDFNNLIQGGLQDAAVTFGEGIGKLVSGEMDFKDFGKSMLSVVGNFMVQFGQLIIAFAIAAAGLEAAIKTPGAWPIALAAGIALVAVGSAISSLSKKGMGGGGGGGAASGYSGAQGQSSGSQSIQGNVVFELRGNTLKGVLNNQDRRNYNMG